MRWQVRVWSLAWFPNLSPTQTKSLEPLGEQQKTLSHQDPGKNPLLQQTEANASSRPEENTLKLSDTGKGTLELWEYGGKKTTVCYCRGGGKEKSWVRDPALITTEMYYYKGGKDGLAQDQSQMYDSVWPSQGRESRKAKKVLPLSPAGPDQDWVWTRTREPCPVPQVQLWVTSSNNLSLGERQ